MRSKPRKKKAKRLRYRKNWKSCSTAKTRVRMLPPFLQPSYASRSRFEAVPPTHFSRRHHFIRSNVLRFATSFVETLNSHSETFLSERRSAWPKDSRQ